MKSLIFDHLIERIEKIEEAIKQLMERGKDSPEESPEEPADLSKEAS
jgi:uncharacterized protein (UPF0335 family)